MIETPATAERLCRLLNAAALGCLLVVLVTRPFVSEAPFRLNDYPLSPDAVGSDPAELTRVTMAMIVLAGVTLWSLGQFYRPGPRTRVWWLGAMALFLAGWTFVSTFYAVDRRGALDGWLDQNALIFGALVLMQLARRRLLLVLVVLAALAATLGYKAIEQVTYEIPSRVAAFKADPEKQLAMANLPPGTPQARMFEKRLTDPAAFGYQGLSNVFAGVLLIPSLVALGLGIDKLRLACALPKPAKGEVSLPLVSAVVTLGMAALGGAGLLLTRSKGGIGSFAAALAALLVVGVAGKYLLRWRGKALLLCLLALAALVGGTTVYGLRRGGLPGRSLQVRWEYWVGAAELIRRHPLFGVGSDNFGFGYLRYRLPEAAESTKTAHNIFLDAAAQYGVPGEAMLLVLIGAIFVLSARPVARASCPCSEADGIIGKTPGATSAKTRGATPASSAGVQPAGKSSSNESDADSLKSILPWIALLSCAVLVARLPYIGTSTSAGIAATPSEWSAAVLLEAVVPAALLAIFMLAAAWSGSKTQLASAKFARIACVCGVAGFFLHNLVEYTIWMPSSAAIFWFAAAAAAGPTLCESPKLRHRPTMLACFLLAMAALVLSGQFLWQRAYDRRVLSARVQADVVAGNITDALATLKEATRLDPLDAFAPAAAARAYWSEALHFKGDQAAVKEAIQYATLAFQRQPSSDDALLLARILFMDETRRDEALAMAKQAVDLDPMDVRTRMDYAALLLEAGRSDEALRQTEIVRSIDNRRPPGSDLLLTTPELQQLDALAAKAQQPKAN